MQATSWPCTTGTALIADRPARPGSAGFGHVYVDARRAARRRRRGARALPRVDWVWRETRRPRPGSSTRARPRCGDDLRTAGGQLAPGGSRGAGFGAGEPAAVERARHLTALRSTRFMALVHAEPTTPISPRWPDWQRGGSTPASCSRTGARSQPGARNWGQIVRDARCDLRRAGPPAVVGRRRPPLARARDLPVAARSSASTSTGFRRCSISVSLPRCASRATATDGGHCPPAPVHG